MSKPKIKIISKSPSPPWNDSAKNIVKAIIEKTENYDIEYFSDGKGDFSENHKAKKIFNEDTSYSLSLKQQISVFLDLLKPDYGNSIYHYFFSPNIKSSLASSFIQKLKYQPSIQTVLSLPENFDNPDILFFGTEIVTMSDTAKLKLNKLGFENVTRIYPGVDIKELTRDDILFQKNKFGLDNESLTVLYAGDYHDGLYPFLELIKELESKGKNYKFIFAVREKSAKDRDRLFNLKVKIKELGISRSFLKLYGELEDFKNLMIASDILFMPQTNLYGKMDIPLVILEAMAYKKRVVTFKSPFYEEINKNDTIYIVSGYGEFKSLLETFNTSVISRNGADNLKVVENYFTTEIMVKNYEKLYQRLL